MKCRNCCLHTYLCPCVQSLYGLFQDCQLPKLSHPPWVIPAAGLGVMTKGEGEREGEWEGERKGGGARWSGRRGKKDDTQMERGGGKGLGD